MEEQYCPVGLTNAQKTVRMSQWGNFARAGTHGATVEDRQTNDSG